MAKCSDSRSIMFVGSGIGNGGGPPPKTPNLG
jgi:hypothetical protein